MIKKQFFFSCDGDNCDKKCTVPYRDSIQSASTAREFIKKAGWKSKGANIDICPACAKGEYQNSPSAIKKERNLQVAVLYIRGTSMNKLAKLNKLSVERVSQIINREINKQKPDLSQIEGFTDCQESSFLDRCLQFKEKTVRILLRGQK